MFYDLNRLRETEISKRNQKTHKQMNMLDRKNTLGSRSTELDFR